MRRTHEFRPAAADSQNMRPTTPNLKIPRSVGPSSPPQTPTATSPVLGYQNGPKARTMASPNPLFHPMAPGFTARPSGKGQVPNFSHTRPGRHEQLSPRSSSLSSNSNFDSDEPASPSSPEFAVPAAPPPASPPRVRSRTVTNTALVIEELSDFTDSDHDRPGVIRPTAIEDAESDRSRSRSRYPPELYQRIMSDLGNLHCDDSSDYSDYDEFEHQEFLRKQREAKKIKRMTSGSIGKRTHGESIGSDTDREDLRPFIGVDEAGSSARRLRRRIGNRHSLQFQDPPPGIEELEEPESSIDEMLTSESLARELPYYKYVSMEVDSP